MLASREAGSLGVDVLTGGDAQSELAASGVLGLPHVGEFLTRPEEIGIAKDNR